MAGIFFQPQQPDYRGLWDWNPVQTFITSKNELEAANLRQAEADRLKAKTDLDMRVTEQMLPLEMKLAQAKIAKIGAEQNYLNRRADKDIEDATADIFYGNYQSGDLDKAFPSAPTSSPRAGGSSSVLDRGSVLSPSSSSSAGGDFSSFSLTSPLTSFAPNEQPQVLDEIASKIPEDQVAAVTNPPIDRMTASVNGAGPAVELPLVPSVRNKLDWDNDPRTVADLETSNPLTSLQIPEAKRKELEALNDSSGALNAPKDEASVQNKPQGVGEMLVSQYGKIRRAEEIAAKSKGETKAKYLGLAYGGRDDLGASIASALNLADRSLGSQAAEALLKSPNGQIRDSGAINKIVALVDKGLGIGEAVDIYEATRKNELANMFKEPAKDDSVKQTQEFFNLAKSWQEAKSKSQENPEDKESQVVFKMLSNRLKTIGGEEYKQLEFGYNQEQYANMMQYYGQKVRPDGQPTEGLKDKTADQVRLELIKSGAIPVVEGVAGDNGISYDTDDLASKFPGGKLVEGAFVALRNPNAKSADQEFQTHRTLNGRLAKLSSPSEPDKPQPKREGSASDALEKTPNNSGKIVYDSARPYFQEAPSKVAGRVVDRGVDAVLNAGDYAATAIRNRAVAPAAEFLAGAVGEDLDLGRTPNAKPQDRPKQLTPEERIQIIERLTGGPLQSAGREIIRKKLNK